jgi:hypothetical protein
LAKRGPTPERLVAGAKSGKRISGRKEENPTGKCLTKRCDGSIS